MLVLSRKCGQGVVVDDNVEVTVLEICGRRVKLGFRGPAHVPIHREEVQQSVNAFRDALYHAECA